MGKIGVFIEIIDGNFKKINKEVLGIAKKSGEDVYAITFTNNIENFTSELSGLKGIINIKTDLDKYQPDIYANTIKDLIKEKSLNNLLGGYTALTRDLFPRIAAKSEATLVNDCIEIDLKSGTAVKPVYAGKLLQQYSLNDKYNLYTVRSNTFPVEKSKDNSPSPIEEYNLKATKELTRIVDILKNESGHIDIGDADIIVSGGRGLGSKENFDILFDLASIIKAGVGASRAAVDAEYATSNMQVGQTGKVVNPKLYMAFGISGAIQHFVGMKTSKIIVAVNKDIDAPLFKKTDYGIVGDLFEVIPLLKEELKKID